MPKPRLATRAAQNCLSQACVRFRVSSKGWCVQWESVPPG